jgi:predicted DNA-binding transcriptional regulator YafY
LNVVDKTIRRDLQFLAGIGFPLTVTVGDNGRKSWRLDFPAGVPPLSFTLTEAAALHVGRELMLPLAGTDFGDGAHSAFRKIRSALGDAAVKYLAKLAAVFHATSFGASDYSGQTEIIDPLMIACEDSKVAFITYQSQRSTEPVTVEVYPYGLVHHKGSFYLVAFAREHNEVRHYKVNRINAVDIQAQQIPVQRPAGFDLKRHLTDSFGIMRGDGVTRRRRSFTIRTGTATSGAGGGSLACHGVTSPGRPSALRRRSG